MVGACAKQLHRLSARLAVATMRLDLATNIIETKVEQLKRAGENVRVVLRVKRSGGVWHARLVRDKEILASGQSCSMQSAIGHLAISIGLMK